MTQELNANATAERTRCEVYSRVVGYIRPVSQWNEGKQAEFDQRVEFNVCGCEK